MPRKMHDPNTTLEYLRAYKRAHNGLSPCVREICDHLGITSTSTAFNVLRRLEKQGLVKRTRAGIVVHGGQWLTTETPQWTE